MSLKGLASAIALATLSLALAGCFQHTRNETARPAPQRLAHARVEAPAAKPVPKPERKPVKRVRKAERAAPAASPASAPAQEPAAPPAILEPLSAQEPGFDPPAHEPTPHAPSPAPKKKPYRFHWGWPFLVRQ